MSFVLFDCREFGRIIIACVVITLLFGVVLGLLYLITGSWQNWKDAFLVMISALIGNVMWDVVIWAMKK